MTEAGGYKLVPRYGSFQSVRIRLARGPITRCCMSVADDVALLERVPALRLLGRDALRVLAVGSEHREFAETRRGAVSRPGTIADCRLRGAAQAPFRVALDGRARRRGQQPSPGRAR